MKQSHRIVAAAAALAAAFAAAPSFAVSSADGLGERANAVPDRVIVLDGHPRWVNVDAGQTVEFVSQGHTFEWQFSGLGNAIKLSQIAPQDFGAPDLTVYVNQSYNPLNVSSGGSGD